MVFRIKPVDFEMSADKCPPGHFVWKYKDEYHLCFKSEYGAELQYYNESGEAMNIDYIQLIPVEMVKCEE
jgi:hypothetical protein